jgi:hypothetical protein
MDGGFACPDCGCEIRVQGLSPGRQVHCDWCEALVEVPFIPRADLIKRMRRERKQARRRGWPLWANVVVILLTVAIVVAGAGRLLRHHWRSVDSDMLTRLMESSRAEEDSGRLEAALSELEAAVAFAHKLDPPPPCLGELESRRASVSNREAREQLSKLSAYQPNARDEPAQSLGRALTLQARTSKDPALSNLREPVAALLERLRTQWASVDARASEQALEEGQPERAMSFCIRMQEATEDLANPIRTELRGQAHSLAERIVSRHGIVIEPVTGEFTLGSPESYASLLRPSLYQELQKHGFLPRTRTTPWDDLWLSHSRYRVTTVIKEHQDDVYLDSMNRITIIDSRLSVLDGSQVLWYEAPIGRTQVPLPGIPALMAGRMAASDHRSQEFEKLLYNNARDALIERLAYNLRNLSRCPRLDH